MSSTSMHNPYFITPTAEDQAGPAHHLVRSEHRPLSEVKFIVKVLLLCSKNKVVNLQCSILCEPERQQRMLLRTFCRPSSRGSRFWFYRFGGPSACCSWHTNHATRAGKPSKRTIPVFGVMAAPTGFDGFLKPYLVESGGSSHNFTRQRGKKGVGRGSSNKVMPVLSIFDIPPGLLTGPEDVPSSTAHSTAGLPAALADSAATGGVAKDKRGLTCIRCELTFDARPAQLAHFKSALHMTNLRRQLSGERPLSQQQLDIIDEDGGVGDGQSGAQATNEESQDSSSDSEAEHGAAATAEPMVGDTFDERDVADGLALARVASVEEITESLIRTTSPASADRQDGGPTATRGVVRVDFSLQEGPRLTFTPSGSAWCFSLSSAALGLERGSDPWERLDALFVGEEEGGMPNRLWAVVIVQSGKFAAGVFEGQSVLCHKVFKRYTIRAKRGGSQSSYDSGGRRAQSAGATLRRYGEQTLREDARALLKEWEEPLKACRVILTSVPKIMRTLLFEGKDAPFDRKDPRLRPIPFAVSKPVFEEVVAVHTRVTSIVFAEAGIEDHKAATDANSDRKADSKDEEPVKPTSLEGTSKTNPGRDLVEGGGVAGEILEQTPCPPSKELIKACEQDDLATVIALLDSLDLTVDEHIRGEHGAITSGGDTALEAPQATGDGNGVEPDVPAQTQAAGWTTDEVVNRPDGLERLMTPLHVAAEGGHATLIGTLLERGASPLAEDVRGRVAYLLAPNKDTRDAFRRARAAQPERWDWDASKVPEPLTEELEQRQKEKQKEKEKEKRRRAKQRKKGEKANAEEEERRRKEKEAAEAEERKARGLAAHGHCDACGKAVIEKKAFHRFEFTYCSIDCANAHKRKLAADAAERRLNKV